MSISVLPPAGEASPVLNRHLYVLVGVLAIALTPIATVVLRPASELMDGPMSEDAFYSLTVARNLALGNGLTIDGVHWTNGFQPLFTFLCSVLYLLTPHDDRIAPLRMLTVVQAGMFMMSAALFGSILSRAVPTRAEVKRVVQLVGMICFLLSDFLFVQAFNGLETGFLLLMVLFTLDSVFRLTGTPANYAWIGVLLGLCFLARIDTCFLVVGFCLANLKFGPGAPTKRFVGSMIAGSCAVLVSLPWLLYSELVFGSLMPISGRAYSSTTISGERLLLAVTQTSNALVPYFRYPEHIWRSDVALRVLTSTSLLFFAILAAATIQLKRLRGKAIFARLEFTSASLLLATTLILYCMLLTLYYGFVSIAIHFYARYLVPCTFLGVSVIAILLGIAASQSRLASYLVGLLLIIEAAHLHVERSYMGESGHYHEAVELVRQHVPPGAAVAASQSGTLGYFCDHVVNLDGKVNQDVLAYRGSSEILPQFLVENKIDWYVDWAELPLTAKLAGNGQWVKVEQVGRTVLLHRTN